MKIKPIKNRRRDYRRALKQIEGLMHAKRNTPAGDWLDVLVVLLDPNWPPSAYVGKSLATGGENLFVLQNDMFSWPTLAYMPKRRSRLSVGIG